MRVFRLLPFLFLLATVVSFAQTSSAAKPAPGFSIDNIDKSIDPCVDFYQYACGNWIKNSEIPADQSRWGSFDELHESNLKIARGILEKAAAGGPARDAVDQRIGDLYGSCMDEKTVDAKAVSPVQPELDRIAATQDKGALIDELARLRLVGGTSLFSFYSSSDLHNADQVIAYIDQGGLSLPDRDYYLKDDNAKMKEMQQHLVEYVTQAFTLAGQTPQQAADSAQTVLRIETSLAKAAMDRTARRDPKNLDHKMSRDEAVARLRPGPGDTVLEIGCGTGRNLIMAARAYPEAQFFGLDVSREMLGAAAASIARAGLSSRISITQADATAFDPVPLFGHAQFDRVMISYALSMIPPWREALERALDVLAPGGSLHLVDFGDCAGLPGAFKIGLRRWLAAFDVTPRDDLRDALEALSQERGLTCETRRWRRAYAVLAVVK